MKSRWIQGLLSLGLAALATTNAFAQAVGIVKTIAGAGPGYVDGNNTFSLLNNPQGLAVDSRGFLLVADKGNNAIRWLRTSDNLVGTLIPPVHQANYLRGPVAVAVNSAGFIYVANEDSGEVLEFDRFGNLLGSVVSGLTAPSALAIDAQGNLFVAEQSGRIRRHDLNGAVTGTYSVNQGTPEIHGLALLDQGRVAVSDAGNHVVWLFNAPGDNGQVFAGKIGVADFADGIFGYSRLNRPWQITPGKNGSVVIADRGNHRVRILGCDGSVDTFFGVDEAQWEVFDAPGIFPGWLDGSVQFAESREPVGVAVLEGVVFDSEAYYHLVRSGTGLTFPPSDKPGGGPGGTNNPGGTITNLVGVPTPLLTPSAGYFPMGHVIEVTSSNSPTGFGDAVQLYYTLDGVDPSTNSQALPKRDGKAFLDWRLPALDLTSLKVRAFTNGVGGPVVSGQPRRFEDVNLSGEIGIPEGRGELAAGLGSTLVLPVVANLKPGVELRSLQFVIEVSPLTGAARIEAPLHIKALTISTNDFVQVAMASTNPPTTFASTVNGANRLAVAFLGTNQVFRVPRFGTVAMISVPIPPMADSQGVTSKEGSQYEVRVTQISGTADGVQEGIRLTNMPPRIITVRNQGYLAGDSSPGYWYNAGDFGDGSLGNGDVNNAFYASIGFRSPYPFTDAFDAMDVVPEDTAGTVGGDGEIRFLDWQVLLRRSLGFNTNNWRRFWSQTGVRRSERTAEPRNSSPTLHASAASVGYSKQAKISAGTVVGVFQGIGMGSPVTVEVSAGAAVSGMQFVAYVTSDDGQPAVHGVQFVPAAGMPAPTVSGSSVPGIGTLDNAVFCSWDVGTFTPALAGSSVIGDIRFVIPPQATSGKRYTVHFEKADGAAADLTTMYGFESFRGDVWVNSGPVKPRERLPDEWKLYYFDSLTAPEAQADADSDGDGFNNYAEYRAGLNPQGSDWSIASNAGQWQVRWFAETGHKYVVESSDDLKTWTPRGNAVTGTDALVTHTDAGPASQTQFYRIRPTP